MATWALAQLGRREKVLGASALETLHGSKIVAAGVNPLTLAGLEWLGPPGYGYGWFLGQAHAQRAVYHMGLVDGFRR